MTSLETAQLHALAAEVARALGVCWSYDPEANHFAAREEEPRHLKHYATIRHIEGFGLQFWGGEKLRINGAWPTYTTATGETQEISPRTFSSLFDGNQWTPEINVSLTKSAAQIAREIERRLFPAYLPKWSACKERAEAWGNSEAAKLATREKVSQFPGVKLHSGRNGYSDSAMEGYIEFEGDRRSARLRINSADSVEVTFHVTADQLRAMLDAIA